MSTKITDKGPWRPGVTADGRRFIESDDFTHDVRLYVDGDFASVDDKSDYANGIAQQLNAPPVSAAPVACLWRERRFLGKGEAGSLFYGDWTDWEPSTISRGKSIQSKTGQDAQFEIRWLIDATPVSAQPDLTQQTLDDVKAGIPARDAEIEALRMEIEAQHAAQANAKQELAPVSDFDLAILSQQYTLPVDIFISAARQVIELYLAAQAQQSLTDADIDRIAAPWLHPDGQANSSDIRAIVRAIHAQQPVSGADGLPELPDIAPTDDWDSVLDCIKKYGVACYQAALAQQDADKVDAQTYRALVANCSSCEVRYERKGDDANKVRGFTLSLRVGEKTRQDMQDNLRILLSEFANRCAAIDAARKEVQP